MTQTWLNKRIFFILLLAILFVGGILYLWNVLLPFIVGLLMAYFLEPVVKFLEINRYLRIKRPVGIGLIFLVFIAIFTILLVVLFNALKPDSLKPLIEDIPKYGRTIEKEYHGILKHLKQLGIPIDTSDTIEIRKKLFKEAETFFKHFLSSLKDIFTSLFNSVFYLLIVPLSTFYFLKDKEKIFNTIKKYIKDEKEEQIKEIFSEIDEKIGGYIKGQLLTSLLVAVAVIIVLLIFKVPYHFLLGVLAGIANIIPYFGPLIGAAPPIIIAISDPAYSTMEVVILIGFFVILNVVVGFLITPKITSKVVNIHPLTVILAIFVGNAIFGVIGMLLAVPVAIIVKVLLLLVFKRYIKEI